MSQRLEVLLIASETLMPWGDGTILRMWETIRTPLYNAAGERVGDRRRVGWLYEPIGNPDGRKAGVK